jgi:hypothetical protein
MLGTSSISACSPNADVGADAAVAGVALSVPSGLPSVHGSLYTVACRRVGASYVCSPFQLKLDGSGMQPRVIQLANVVQDSVQDEDVGGSGVDPTRGLAYAHRGCTGNFIVTDIAAQSSKLLPLPAGMPCAQGFFYDAAQDTMFAIGGREEPILGNASVDVLAEIDHAGEVHIVRSIRPPTGSHWKFLHPYQTIGSLDPLTREIWTQVADGTSEYMLRTNVDTGTVRTDMFGGPYVQSFYESESQQRYFFGCSSPPDFRSTTGSLDLTQKLVTDFGLPPFISRPGSPGCQQWYVGGGYDETERLAFEIFKDQNQQLKMAIVDIANLRLLGIFATGLTTAKLGLRQTAFYMPVVFVPDVE